MSNQEIGIQLYFKDPLLVSQGKDLDFIITKVYFPSLDDLEGGTFPHDP